MTYIKLKSKNQVTIPQMLVKHLHLGEHELLAIDIKDNYIRLMPVRMEPKYSAKELKAIDHIVHREKAHGKKFKAGENFASYIDALSK